MMIPNTWYYLIVIHRVIMTYANQLGREEDLSAGEQVQLGPQRNPLGGTLMLDEVFVDEVVVHDKAMTYPVHQLLLKLLLGVASKIDEVVADKPRELEVLGKAMIYLYHQLLQE